MITHPSGFGETRHVIARYRQRVSDAANAARAELHALREAGMLTDREYAYLADGFRPAAHASGIGAMTAEDLPVPSGSV